MSNYKGKFVLGTKNHPWNIAFDFVRENSSVLDVGCSNGAFGGALIEFKKCVVDGIEPDRDDARLASKILRDVEPGYVEDVLESKFKLRKYDHIVFLDVLEHLVKPTDTLKLVKKHLKPNGSVIFSIPNMAHMSVRLMLLEGEFEYGETGLLDKTHLHFYTRKEIERIFAEAGFIIEKMNYTEAAISNLMVQDRLNKIGITTTDKSISHLNSADAKIFQYVGCALNGDAEKSTREFFSPDPQGTQSDWFEEMYRRFTDQIKELNLELNKLKAENEGYIITLNDRKSLADLIGLKFAIKHYVAKKIKRLGAAKKKRN